VDTLEYQQSNIEVTRIFIENRTSEQKVLVNRGGARSSKSYSIIQLLVDNFFSLDGRQILIGRKTSPALRRSCYRDVIRYLRKLGVYDLVHENKSEMALYYKESLIQFVGLDDPDKIKSTEWNDIFMEEANEFDYNDYMVLKTRLSAPDHGVRNKLFMAFNPEDTFHWIKERVIDLGDRDCREIHSSYKDNPFLSDDYVQELIKLEEQDYNYYRIYGLGEWGKLDHLIYGNWDLVGGVPENPDEWFYGLDFGFNAPSALIKITLKDEEVWEEELLYETGLTNTDLIERMKELIPPRDRTNRYIFCDAAEPDRIEEIQAAGFTAIAAEKKVKEGIDMVQRQKIHIVNDSVNLIKEKRSYSWKQDKRNNQIIDDPVKFNDHLMDAERYAMFTYFKEIGAVPEVRWL
jgi:phage terminase large subunit